MFDYAPSEIHDEPASLARCLLFDHGHELAAAAAMLGGASAEAKVVSCALAFEDAGWITPRVLRDLLFLYRLLSLDCVGDPGCLETELFSGIDPASPVVGRICLLTDQLEDILDAIDASDPSHDAEVFADQFAAV